MNMNKFTVKSQEALQAAQEIAVRTGVRSVQATRRIQREGIPGKGEQQVTRSGGTALQQEGIALRLLAMQVKQVERSVLLPDKYRHGGNGSAVRWNRCPAQRPR